jgi:hypothetical protein
MSTELLNHGTEMMVRSVSMEAKEFIDIKMFNWLMGKALVYLPLMVNKSKWENKLKLRYSNTCGMS